MKKLAVVGLVGAIALAILNSSAVFAGQDDYIRNINKSLIERSNPFYKMSDEDKLSDGKNICLALYGNATREDLINVTLETSFALRRQYGNTMADKFIDYRATALVHAVYDICPEDRFIREINKK